MKISSCVLVFVFIAVASTGFAADDGSDKKNKTKKTLSNFEFSARVRTGFLYEHEKETGAQGNDETYDYKFLIDQARIKLKSSFGKYVRINISAELTDAFESKTQSDDSLLPDDSIPYLRNAFLDLGNSNIFQLRAGRFKRPFSRLELRSSGDIPFYKRGLSNKLLVEKNEFGDRSTGVMARGKIKKAKLSWAVSATNVTSYVCEFFLPLDNSKIPQLNEFTGINTQARFEYRPIKPLSIGLNGSKITANYDFKDLSLPHINMYAAGVDARISIGNFYFAAEFLYAWTSLVDLSITSPSTNLITPKIHDVSRMGITSYLSYKIKIGKKFKLEPVISGEFADSDIKYTNTEAIRAVFGINLLYGKWVRLMPQVKIIRPLGVLPDGSSRRSAEDPVNEWKKQEQYYLIFQVAI